jgi:tetratricopeptide (TPR) repeat protein
MAIALGDRARTGRAASQLAYILFLRGDLEDAAECAQRALQIGDELGDLALQVAARIRLTEISEQQGDFRRACEHARWMLASVPEGASGRLFGTTVVPAAQFRSMLATSLAQLGEFDEATRMAFDAVRAADAADHPFSQAMACCNVGVAVLPSGDFGAAIEILERGRLVCETWGIWSFNQVTISLLAYAYVLAGRPDDGVQLVEEVERRAVTEGRLRNLLDAPLRRTETLLAAGRLDEAHVQATELLAYHQSVGEPANRAWVLRLLGEIAMRRDPPGFNEAETHHREALALAEESEMRPLQARCHLGLGTLFRRIGRLDEARSELSTAVVMLREMGMALWLPEAEAELAQVGSQQ